VVVLCACMCGVQGAGGNCNVVKEIIYPLGAEIDVRAVKVRGLGLVPHWGRHGRTSMHWHGCWYAQETTVRW
jgi:hypothetical protein